MNLQEMRRGKEAVEREHGPWTAHNIRLTEELYTIKPELVGPEAKLWRIVRAVTDLSPRPVAELRVLDLACMEGLYAVELARQGARAVGIEAREKHVAKARFAKEALGLANLEFHQDDVRNLSREKYGEFDLTLCVGIFYHLDAPDIFHFMKRIAEVTTEFAVIDTHVQLEAAETREFEGRTYWGGIFEEHGEGATEEEKREHLWASIDNPKSFWLTRPSLINLLHDVGFTSVHQTYFPASYEPEHRVCLIARKGKALDLQSTPPGYEKTEMRYPEQHQEAPQNSPIVPVRRPPARSEGLRQRLKRLLG